VLIVLVRIEGFIPQSLARSSLGRVRCLLLQVAVMALSSVLVAATVLAGESHCAKDEEVVFSCGIGSKIVSLCASKDISETQGSLTYTFGKIGKPELRYPSAGTDPRAAFTYHLLPRGDYVRFSNRGATYVLFSAFGSGVGDYEGLVVQPEGKDPIRLNCKEPALGPHGWAPVYKAKLPDDAEEFEIPD
jgi:hypothetical protein